MGYWLPLLVMSFMMSMQSVFVKVYERRVGSSMEESCVMSLLRSVLMVLFFWALNGFGFTWRSATVLWGTAHGVTLAVTMVTTAMAYMTGPFALSTLIISSSMVLVTLYGIVFLHEPVTVLKGLGILLVFTSLLLLNTGKKEDKKLTGAWWAYVLVGFFFNAGCNLTQKLHQIGYPAGYENDFMILACAVCTLLCGGCCLARRVPASVTGRALRQGWWPIVGAGGACAIANVLIMYLNARMPASLLYPTNAGLGLIIAALLGRFVYREQTTRRQAVSFILGVVAIVLMNI